MYMLMDSDTRATHARDMQIGCAAKMVNPALKIVSTVIRKARNHCMTK